MKTLLIKAAVALLLVPATGSFSQVYNPPAGGSGGIISVNGDTGPAVTGVSFLGASTPFTTAQTFNVGGISKNNWILIPSTAATSGANQNSPSLLTAGFYWDGAASATDQWFWTTALGAGANPASTYTLAHNGSATTPTVSAPFPWFVGSAVSCATGATCVAVASDGFLRSIANATEGAVKLGGDGNCYWFRVGGSQLNNGCGPLSLDNSVTATSFISPTVGRIGTTASIGGGALIAGTCASGTVAVSGAVVGRPVAVSASDGTLPNALATLAASVTATDTVSVQVCAIAAVTPAAKTYNVSVL